MRLKVWDHAVILHLFRASNSKNSPLESILKIWKLAGAAQLEPIYKGNSLCLCAGPEGCPLIPPYEACYLADLGSQKFYFFKNILKKFQKSKIFKKSKKTYFIFAANHVSAT